MQDNYLRKVVHETQERSPSSRKKNQKTIAGNKTKQDVNGNLPYSTTTVPKIAENKRGTVRTMASNSCKNSTVQRQLSYAHTRTHVTDGMMS